jgi:ABC-type multidrug transport system fused ATPase/permease subunit
MFRIVNRLIQWTGKYKRRIYIGFIYAFIHSIFTAIPIMLAAEGLSAVLDDFNGVKPLESRDIWIMLAAMILAVLGRYLFSYLRAITQESVGYEATADERIRLGDILKRVSLGFFSKNNMGELSAAATTDLSFMEMFAMNMVNTVVNGIYHRCCPDIVPCILQPSGGRNCSGWCPSVCPVSSPAGGAQPPKRSYPSKGARRYGRKLHRVSARDAGGESL